MSEHGHMVSMGFSPGMELGFWVIIVIVVFLIIYSLKDKQDVSKENNDALEILRSRFAKGEISKEEYLNIKETLKK